MSSSNFDHNDARYQCCCGSCHAIQGAKIINIVEIVLGSLALLMNLLQFNPSFLANLAAIVCCAIALYGLSKYNACLVLFGVIYHGVAMVLMFVCGLIILLAGVVFGAVAAQESGGKSMDRHEFEAHASGVTAVAIVLGITAIALMLNGLLCIWFFIVHLSAYRYLKESQLAGAHPIGAHGAHGTTPGVVLSVPTGSTVAYGMPPQQQYQQQAGYSQQPYAPAAQQQCDAPPPYSEKN